MGRSGGGKGYPHSKSRFRSPRHTPTVQDHLIEEDFARILHPQRDHGQAVAYQDHLHARVVRDVGAREVMCGDHGDGFILPSEAAERVECNLLAFDLRWGAKGGVGAVSLLLL